MSVALPGTIPAPILSSYGIEVDYQLGPTATELGAGRLRRRSLDAKVTASLHWNLTSSQMDDWQTWWDATAIYGTEVLSLPIVNGYSLETQDCRALGSPTRSINGGIWSVSLPVEVVAQPIASTTVLDDAIATYDDLILADAFHVAVHTQVPWGLS
jgi:hypothetical protein